MVFCCSCDEKRRVKSSQPATGVCANCGESTSDVEVQDAYAFCFVPLFWRTHHEIMCNSCVEKLGLKDYILLTDNVRLLLELENATKTGAGTPSSQHAFYSPFSGLVWNRG